MQTVPSRVSDGLPYADCFVQTFYDGRQGYQSVSNPIVRRQQLLSSDVGCSTVRSPGVRQSWQDRWQASGSGTQSFGGGMNDTDVIEADIQSFFMRTHPVCGHQYQRVGKCFYIVGVRILDQSGTFPPVTHAVFIDHRIFQEIFSNAFVKIFSNNLRSKRR